MRGLITTQTVNSWVYGFNSTIFDIISQGDFYAGNDKDLVSTINPIFTTKTLKVNSASIKINSGSSDPYSVSEIEQINGKPFINSLMSIYDGSQSQPLPVNLWNREVPLNSISNGLQFSPSSTEETISTFESLYQRPFTYTYDRDSTAVGEYDSTISIKVFVEKDLANPDGDQLKPSPANTLNLGPAFNLNYVIGKQGCINCDSKLTSKVLVN